MNNKKIWVSVPSYAYIKSHAIGMNIPNLYNYADYRKAVLDSYTNELSQENQEKIKDFIDYGCEISNKINNFKKLEILPDVLYAEDEKQLPDDYEYVFQILGGAVIVNQACAKVLKRFRLGNSTLTPLKIRDVFDDNMWTTDTFYFLNLCEKREYVKIPQSHDYFKLHKTPTSLKYSDMNLCLENNLLEVDKSIIECDVDIWHDPRFRSSYFFSDELRQALIQANMLDKWNMKFCKLVSF